MTPRAREMDELLDVRAVASLMGLSVRRARYRLKAIEKLRGGVIVRLTDGERGRIVVTRSRLLAAFPEHFEEKHAKRSEVDDLATEIEELKKRQNALAARFREASHQWLNRPK